MERIGNKVRALAVLQAVGQSVDASSDGKAFVTVQSAAHLAKCSVSTARRVIRHAVKEGWLRDEGALDGTRKFYSITSHGHKLYEDGWTESAYAEVYLDEFYSLNELVRWIDND